MAYEAAATKLALPGQDTTFSGSFAPASPLDALQAKSKYTREGVKERAAAAAALMEKSTASSMASTRGSRRPSAHAALPRVFLDVKADNEPLGRIVIELRSDVTPRTADNFRKLCTGQLGYGYRGSIFHRVLPNFVCHGGDFTKHDGSGSKSIYGPRFDDENFELTHSAPGKVSMANCGPHTNGSQFFITTQRAEHLDGKHVVFGHVVEGMDIVKKVEACGTLSGATLRPLCIYECGQLGAKNYWGKA